MLLLLAGMAAASEPPQSPAAEDVARIPTLLEANALAEAGDWPAAIRVYEALARRDPSNPEVWFRLAVAIHSSGDLDRAIVAHQKAAEFPNIRPTALFNLACAYSLKGDTVRALMALNEAVDIGYANKASLERDPDLAAIRGDPRFQAILQRFESTPSDPLRHFDFFLGTWDVLARDGNVIGFSRVEAREGGRVVLETFTGLDGDSASAVGYFDPADRRWKVTIVSSRGDVARYSGAFTTGAMRMAGTHTAPDGTQTFARATLLRQADGRIRALVERTEDRGRTWTVERDVTYVARKDAVTDAGAP